MKTLANTRHYLQSSSFKMAAFFTLLLGMSSLLLSYFLYDFSHQNFMRETEAAIDSEIERMLFIARNEPENALAHYITERAKHPGSPIYLYRDATGHTIAGTIGALPDKVARITEGVIQFTTVQHRVERTVAAKIHTFADGSSLLVARDIHSIIQSYEKFRWFSILIMLFMLIVVLVSFLISAFVVSRINRIATIAQHIMDTGDLSQRISVDSNWDDLSNLAHTLNMLLTRIESLLQDIRDVSDNIAHDLRTPLTRLRNRLEAMHNSRPSGADIQTLVDEADQLLATFHVLLRIANLEKGKRHQPFAPVALHVLLRDVIEFYEPLLEEKNLLIDCQLTQPLSIMGDADLLFQLCINLMDNAIKFSPTGGTISIRLQQQQQQACITIADEGIGIDDAEKTKVFDRFYRSDKSRHTAGTGLGLSLAKAALELHHGTIVLHDNMPGLLVEMQLPLSKTPPAHITNNS